MKNLKNNVKKLMEKYSQKNILKNITEKYLRKNLCKNIVERYRHKILSKKYHQNNISKKNIFRQQISSKE